jgi:hypothetical protein
LLVHALLLSITLGGQTFGMPGLNFPWKERRLGPDDLRILLAPAQPTAPAEMAEAALTPVEKPAIANNVMLPPAVEHSEAAAVSIPPPTPAPTLAPAVAPSPESAITTPKRPDVSLPIAPDAPRVRAADLPMARTTLAQVSEMPVPSDAVDAAQKQIDQDTQERALEQARINRETQNAERLQQAELMADAKREATRQEQLRKDAARAEQTARNEAARIEGERQELVRQEGLRREALQKERARQDEKAQQEAARQELERAEASRLEAGRREAARQEQARQAQLEATRLAQLEAARQAQLESARQARLDAERQEVAKQEATRQDAMKQEAARQDAVKQAAARQEAAKQEAARQEAARIDQVQRERAEQEAKREERLRAIGKQLAEEAAQRDAASNRPSRSLLPTASSLRRGWLLGRADPNAELVLYAEAMSRKIEMNMTFDMVREAVKQPHAQPIVTVAVRADGSVEKVTFVVSSGVAAIDEAIRKVVASQAPYPVFPPALARQYDVIEIRRTWIFDVAIRLQ